MVNKAGIKGILEMQNVFFYIYSNLKWSILFAWKNWKKNGVNINTALTCRSTHLSRNRLLFNSHRSPEEVMQKVEPDVEPRPQATSQKKLFLSSPSSPDRPSKGTVALAWEDEFSSAQVGLRF